MKQKSHFPKKNGFLLKKLLLYLFLKRVKIRTFLELRSIFLQKIKKKASKRQLILLELVPRAEVLRKNWISRRKKPQPSANPISPRRIGYILRHGDMGLVGK